MNAEQRVLTFTGVEAFSHPSFIHYPIRLIGVILTVGLLSLTGVLSTNVFGVR